MAKTNTLTGMTWGHRRAIDPLLAASEEYGRLKPTSAINWKVRTLQDFEHQSIEDAAKTSDFVIFDHPFVGRIEETGAFIPLEEVGVALPSDDAFMGRSGETYRWGGKTWAAPVDSATIHAFYRQEIMDATGLAIPQSWSDVISLSKDLQAKGKWSVIAAKGHHGLLTLMSLCANAGVSWAAELPRLLDEHKDTVLECLENFHEAVSLSHPKSLEWNAIDAYDAMVNESDIAYCPAAYGYGTYGEADTENRISFAAFPGLRAPYRRNTMIGGAGIGVTASCKNLKLARDFINFLMLPSTQTIFAENHGQPALASCWDDPELDAKFNGYFSKTKETTETALIRPRFSGYQTFEMKMGEVLQSYLASDISQTAFIEELAKQVALCDL